MSDMLPRPQPRGGFKRALRAQLMAQAPSALAPRETAWRTWQRAWLRPTLAAAAVLVLVAGGAGKAAADSLPGDAGFSIKLAAEQLQLAFAPDGTTRLRILAEQADHRLTELGEALSTRPERAPAAEQAYATAVQILTTAVDTLRAQPNVSDDNKTAAQDVVDAAHQLHEQILTELEGNVAPAQRSDVERAKSESDKLHPSDQPARTAAPSKEPDRTRSPQPARTAEPTRGADSTHGSEATRTPGSAAEPTRSPGPTDHD